MAGKKQAERITVSIGLLLLRVAVGAAMLVHGWPKLMNFSERAGGFPDPLGIGNQLSLISAIGTEVGCSVLLILGLATRLAGVALTFTMCVIVFLVHGADPWAKRELAALYLAIYASLIFTGGGRLALDQVVWRRFQRRS